MIFVIEILLKTFSLQSSITHIPCSRHQIFYRKYNSLFCYGNTSVQVSVLCFVQKIRFSTHKNVNILIGTCWEAQLHRDPARRDCSPLHWHTPHQSALMNLASDISLVLRLFRTSLSPWRDWETRMTYTLEIGYSKPLTCRFRYFTPASEKNR